MSFGIPLNFLFHFWFKITYQYFFFPFFFPSHLSGLSLQIWFFLFSLSPLLQCVFMSFLYDDFVSLRY